MMQGISWDQLAGEAGLFLLLGLIMGALALAVYLKVSRHLEQRDPSPASSLAQVPTEPLEQPAPPSLVLLTSEETVEATSFPVSPMPVQVILTLAA